MYPIFYYINISKQLKPEVTMWWFIKEEIKDPAFHSGFLVGFLAGIGLIIIGASLAY